LRNGTLLEASWGPLLPLSLPPPRVTLTLTFIKMILVLLSF
jgi:hypothetical protein